MAMYRWTLARTRSAARFVTVVAALATTASCSGSGSGGTDAYSIAPTSLTFQGQGGGVAPAPQEVQVTAAILPIYLKTEISGAAVTSADIQITGERTAKVVVQPASPVALPVGTNTASVRILGCTDPVCSGEVPGSPKTVAVTYTKLAGGMTGSPSTLAFSQTFGAAAPAPSNVTIQDLGGASYAWTSTVTYQSGSGWLTVTPASGSALPATVSVGVVPPAAAGTYTATVEFSNGGTSLFHVDVTYAVSAAFQVTPSTINVVGQQGVATPDQVISLSDAGGASYAWTAQLNYIDGSGWASLAPSSGTALPATVTLSLGALPTLNTTYSAYLTITGAGTPKTVFVYYRQTP